MLQIRALTAPKHEESRYSCENEGKEEEGDNLWWTSRVWAKGMSDLGESAVAKWWFGGSHRFGRVKLDGKIEDVCG